MLQKINDYKTVIQSLSLDNFKESIILTDKLLTTIRKKIISLNSNENREIKEKLILKITEIENSYLLSLLNGNFSLMEKSSLISILIEYANNKMDKIENSPYDLTNEQVAEFTRLKNYLDTLEKIHIAHIYKPEIENDTISLYKKESDTLTYLIIKKDTKEYLGEILYFGDIQSKYITGDIGYMIRKQYQGNNYALKALELFTDILYKNGIQEIYIGMFKSNKASKKTAEKFGGELIPSKYQTSCVYKCDLNKIKKPTKNITK